MDLFRMRGRRPEERQFRTEAALRFQREEIRKKREKKRLICRGQISIGVGMIYIKVGPGTKIIFQGHAGQAPRGSDIVCAGVSTLYMTFQAATGAKETVMGNIRLLEAEPIYNNRAVHKSVCLGLTVLAEKYPEYVRILGFGDYPTAMKNNSL